MGLRGRLDGAGRTQAGGSDPASSELVQSLRCKEGAEPKMILTSPS